jgi:hypothetical protein
MQRSVRTVRVVVLDILAQHCSEVAGPGDQEVVEAFAAQGADPAFHDGVRANGVRMMRMSTLVNIASKVAVNLKSLGVVAEVHE